MNKRNLKYGKEPLMIMDLFEYGRKKKNEIGVDNVYDFSIGNPSAPTPKIVNDTLISLLQNNNKVHSYTSSAGEISIREEIAKYLYKTYQANLEGKYIFLTCGSAAALTISLNALIEENEEVILFAPFFPEYIPYVESAHAKVVISNPDKDFLIDFNDLEKKITSKTKALIIDSPNNPTGVIYKEETIIRLAKLLENKEKEYNHPIYLISDEPYRELIFDKIKYPFVTNYFKHSIVCYSFSKSLSLPGERIGYIALNPENEEVEDLFASMMGAARGLGYINAPSLYQYLIPHILGITADLSIYKKNRDLLYKSLRSIGYELIYPEGAFYIFMKCLEEDDVKFSEIAKEYNLLLVPSKQFGYKGYVRVSYCVNEKTILDSLPAFKKLYERYQK